MQKIFIFVLLVFKLIGENYYINSGINFFSQTEQHYKETFESQKSFISLTLGFDVGQEKNDYEYGAGISIYGPVQYDGVLYTGSYLILPVYLWGKYNFFEDKLYVKGKLGLNFNYMDSSNLEIYNNSLGLFLGFSLGYKFTEKMSFEISYNVSQFKNKENKLSFKENKIFYEGATDLISMSFVYKIGENIAVEENKKLFKLEKLIKEQEEIIDDSNQKKTNNSTEKTSNNSNTTFQYNDIEVIKEKVIINKKETYLLSLGGFEAYQTKLSNKMKESLKKHLKDFGLTAGEIIIESYTDNTGSIELNERLRRERAKNLIEYLRELDIINNFTISEVYLENNIYLTDNSDEESRKKNRRFIIEIFQDEK